MRNVYVLGIGQTVFGKQPHLSSNDLAATAVAAALKDSGINPKELQSAYCGTIYSPSCIGETALVRLGVTQIPVYNVENACASGSTAVHLLHREISLGGCEVGVAFGVESMSAYNKKHGKGLLGHVEDLQAELGLTMPSFFAMQCNKLMEERGATIDDICYASVKNHKNGVTNPYAQYKKEVTVSGIMESAMVVDPITVLQACPQSDGAAAVILCSEEYYKKYAGTSSRPGVKIAGSVIGIARPLDTACDPLALEVMIRSVNAAYEQAGIGPEDVDLVELHDAFSGEELAAYEMLGLCKKGDGVKFARSGAAEIGGSCPVNPSGGLLAMGHPLGASGVRVVVELAKQLWGESGSNQIQGAKVGLAQMLGGVVTNLESPSVCGIQILVK